MRWRDRIRTAVDAAVEIVSPKWALERKAYRRAGSIMAGYEGAQTTRPRSTWVGSGGSADAEILHDLVRLRERSRDLMQNSGAANAVKIAFLDNVVGTGIMPQAAVDAEALGMSPEEAAALNKTLERKFACWAKKSSADGRTSFAEQQAMVMAQVLMNGDVLALPLMLDEAHRDYSLAIELVEADRLDDPYGLSADPRYKDTTTRGGVELGKRGQPVAYWISEQHPGDATLRGAEQNRKFRRVPAYNDLGRPNVLHIYMQDRPGQSRGVPLLAPVLNAFKDLKDYCEAELIATKVAACFTAFVTSQGDALTQAQNRTTRLGTNDQEREQEIAPGAIYYLKAGETVQTATPGRPNPSFEQFVDRVYLDIGASMGLPYELLSRDFRKTNYSSHKAAFLEAHRTFQRWQSWARARFLQPCYEMFVEEVFLRGEVAMPDFYENREAVCRARWIAPAKGIIDPAKELKAVNDAIQANLLTYAEAVAMLSGADWEDVAEQRAREKRRMEELDIEPVVTGVGSAPANQGGDAPDTEDATNG